jgi:hypothetical protein
LNVFFICITYCVKSSKSNVAVFFGGYMKSDDRSREREEQQLVGLSAEILRGRQSVRATFRLPSQVIALLSMAASQLGLKKKSLFDQLVEDREVLEQLAQMADQYQSAGEQRQQKTYVVSRNALLSLESVAKTCGLPRDLLVELSIQRLVPVLNSEHEKQRKRVALVDDLQQFSQLSKRLWRDAGEQLGEEDPASRLLAGLHACCQRAENDLAQLVEQGKELERYQ